MSLKNPKAEHEEVINHAEDYSEPTQAPAQVPAVAQPTGQVAVYQDEEDHFGPRTVKEAFGYFEKVGFEYDPAMAAGCAVISGKIKTGEDMKGEAGDYIDLRVLDVLYHTKVNLGKEEVSNEEGAKQLNCYDGKTVRVSSGVEGEDPIEMDVNEYMDTLRETYPKVSLKERVRIVGIYLGADRPERTLLQAFDPNDEMSDPQLVVIYGPTTTRNQFKTFTAKSMLARPRKHLDIRCTLQEFENPKVNRKWLAMSFSWVPAK